MRLLALLLVAGLGVASAEKVVCYFSSWAVWRLGDGKFDVDNIDPELCTHLIFGFAGLSNHTWTIEVLDPWNELCPSDPGGNNCAYDRFVALKQQNPSLKTIIAVGGWNEGSEDYSVMSADPAKRKTFIDSSLELVKKHGFDGLDLDWEYPTQRGGAPEDKENFITLLAEMRQTFHNYNPSLTLSAAVHCCKPTIDQAYDVKMFDLLDQINIMSYDMHGAWENYTHHNAPLCTLPQDEGDLEWFSLVQSVNYYLSLGAPLEKLVMGIPLYGRCVELADINQNTIYSPAVGPGPAGPYIKIPGTQGFNEVCERILGDESCTIAQDPDMYEPYFYCASDNIWCSFDDAESAAVKARYAKNMGLSGVLVWTIDTDDFLPKCYEEDFHLIRSIKSAINAPADGKLPRCQPPLPTSEPVDPTTTIAPSVGPTDDPNTPNPNTPTANPNTPTANPNTPTANPNTPTANPNTPTANPNTPTAGPTVDPNTPSVSPTNDPHTPSPNPNTTPGGGTTHHPHLRPDCSQHPAGSTFPHEDCNKFWECVNGQAILQQCGPGTLFDEDLLICNWEDNVDTSHCNLWICEVDNTYYPHADCDKYYWCYDGSPHVEQCPNGLYWNQYILQCDLPLHIDTSKCNIV